MQNQNIVFDGAKLAEKVIGALPDHVDRAARKAISLTVRSAKENIGRDIIRQHRLPKSFKQGRIIATEKGVNTLSGSVWIGGNAVHAGQLGALKKNRKGVRAGRHFFKGGFVAKMRSGHTGGFKREKTATRWTKGRPRTSSPNLGLDPLVVVLKNIEKIVSKQRVVSAKRLEKIFIRELKALQRGQVLR